MSTIHDCPDEPGTFVLDVGALAHGPDAVGRHEGRVVFVPGAAPGDRTRVRVREEHGNWARAELVHVCVPGAARRTPPCPWVARCGGCPWQHVEYPVQLAAKETNVRETLARIAGVRPAEMLPIIAAPSELGYRHRIRLHAGPGGALGFRAVRSHDLVEIDACLIADATVSAALAPLRALVAKLTTAIDEVEIVENGRGAIVAHATARGACRDADTGTIRSWLAATPSVAGVALRGRHWQRRFGTIDVTVTSTPDAPPTVQRAGTFTQVNPAANLLLVRTVLAFAGRDAAVLDLFCGAGNLSLPLARQSATVVAVDADPRGIEDGTASAAGAGIANVRFEVGAADRFLQRHGLAGASLVVLDPPRTGAAAVARWLARLRPARIVYVSCEPSTLARDVRTLVGAGYAITRVQPIDVFPQSEHVETVLEAVLTAP